MYEPTPIPPGVERFKMNRFPSDLCAAVIAEADARRVIDRHPAHSAREQAQSDWHWARKQLASRPERLGDLT